MKIHETCKQTKHINHKIPVEFVIQVDFNWLKILSLSLFFHWSVSFYLFFHFFLFFFFFIFPFLPYLLHPFILQMEFEWKWLINATKWKEKEIQKINTSRATISTNCKRSNSKMKYIHRLKMNQREKKTIHVYENKMQKLFSTCTHTHTQSEKE